MKIVLDGRMVRITGIGRYIEELASNLAELGHQPTLLLSPGDESWWRVAHPTIAYELAPEQIYSWSEQLVLPARIKRIHADMVHFTNFNVPLSWKEPFVLTIHDLAPLQFGGERRRNRFSQVAYRRVLASALARAASIIVPSQLVANQLLPWKLGDRVKVVPHGLSDVWRTSPSTPKQVSTTLKKWRVSQPYILYVGNGRIHKNLPTLIAAFSELHRQQPDSSLLLVGPYTIEQRTALESLRSQYNLRDSLVIGAATDDAELRTLYDGARLFVLPSFVEGFGLVALEAAARGLPVIASSRTPVNEFLPSALNFDPSRPMALVMLLTMLWNDTAGRKRISDKLLHEARQRSWVEVARETASVYESSLVKHTQGSSHAAT
jgi:glycosyltransferase involved in cell wall biosynthesis